VVNFFYSDIGIVINIMNEQLFTKYESIE